jgi:7 transmembrane helices usually fused to an inactive transglutaminase/Inactive transglutaminase fused to 7 transmembrane helices
MKERQSFYLVLVLLALAGIVIAFLRHTETGIPFLPGKKQTVWQIEARIDFFATGQPVTASLSLPDNLLPGFKLVEEHAASPGYGFEILNKNIGRRAEWTRRTAEGSQSLYYTAQFSESNTREERDLTPAIKSYPVDWDDAQELAATSLLERAVAMSSSPESLTRQLIKLLNDPDNDQNTALLQTSAAEISEVLMTLLTRQGVPTQSVMGLYLEDARRRQGLTPMVEVYSDNEWLVFNPVTAEEGVPENLLLWHRGGVSVLDVTGGRGSRVSFSMIKQTVSAEQLSLQRESDSMFNALGVQRLPIEEQSMFKLLLLLPLGAAVVVFMRIIVGLRTAGTFMPVLISLTFMQTALLPGLLSFIGVVAIGLLLRGYLSRLNLLMVSRLATLIVLVIFLISILSVVGYQLGYSTGMTITFFPMIIIAWTIERMSILWEEDGPAEVFIQGSGSLLVAVLAYLVMDASLFQHLSFNFPELNLVLLALILAMGRYTGYKLTELWRFRAIDSMS